MNINELNGTQIVLLTLLVSFVTSIATGIATVALIEQAPESVKQPVFNVVERTVERVVKEEVEVPGKVLTTEKTVIVKEEDAVTDAIATLDARLVRIHALLPTQPAGSEITNVEEFLGFGVVLGESGRIITTAPGVARGSSNDYAVSVGNGEPLYARVVSRSNDGVSAILDSSIVRSAITVADSASLRLGQTVLGVSGETDSVVASGIITARNPLGVSFDTTADGMPIVNLFGEVVALSDGETLIFVDALTFE